MIVIDIPDNPNCATEEMRLFNNLEPPQPVTQVRLEHNNTAPAWYAVTGWTTNGTPCPAQIQKVDDSGDGTAFLLYGGDAGLRLQPASQPTPWQLDQPHQWGEPFMIVADREDVKVGAKTDG